MMVAGFDVSTKTGYSFMSYGETRCELIHSGEWQDPAGKRGMVRLRSLFDATCLLLDRYKPDIAVIENYGFANKYTIVPLVELGTMVRFAVHGRCPMVEVSPTSLKVFIAGSGGSKKNPVGKNVMMKEVYKRWGFEGTDNEVDAYSLCKWVGGLLNLEEMQKANMAALERWKKSNPRGWLAVKSMREHLVIN